MSGKDHIFGIEESSVCRRPVRASRQTEVSKFPGLKFGKVAERPNAAVLKTVDPKGP